MDDEMLSLTSQTLCRNPDIYTLWNIRREIFLNLKKEKYAQVSHNIVKKYYIKN